MMVGDRIRMCILIERMDRQKAYSKKIGLEDMSKLHGKCICREEERVRC